MAVHKAVAVVIDIVVADFVLNRDIFGASAVIDGAVWRAFDTSACVFGIPCGACLLVVLEFSGIAGFAGIECQIAAGRRELAFAEVEAASGGAFDIACDIFAVPLGAGNLVVLDSCAVALFAVVDDAVAAIGWLGAARCDDRFAVIGAAQRADGTLADYFFAGVVRCCEFVAICAVIADFAGGCVHGTVATNRHTGARVIFAFVRACDRAFGIKVWEKCLACIPVIEELRAVADFVCVEFAVAAHGAGGALVEIDRAILVAGHGAYGKARIPGAAVAA